MKRLLILAFLLLNFGCSENLFDEIADKDTDEALYFQAKQEINARNYSAAITLLESLTVSFRTSRERLPVYASAYSGRCGLEFLTLLNSLQNTGTSTVLGILMGAFPGAAKTGASGHEDCTQATGILETIGNESERLGDENLLMAFTALSKIGTILSAFADTNNDGVADGTFDQCVDDTDNLPEARVRDIGASFATAILSLGAIGTSYIDGALTDVNAICAADPQLAVFCTSTDPTSFTAAQVQALRYAIGSNDFGIDSCGGNNFTNCALANPACP